MKRKGFALLTSCSLVFSSAFLTSCHDEPQIQPLPDEDDDIILNMEDEPSTAEKILSMALDGINAGAKAGASTVITKAATWLADGIAKEMGLPFASDNAYLKMIDERLGNIENQLTNIESTVIEISQQLKDEGYKNQYKVYQDTYNKYDDVIKSNWQTYRDIEKSLMHGKLTAVEYKKSMDKLSTKINASDVSMTLAAHDLGKSFIAQDISSEIKALSQYSIFDIAKYFAELQTPYEENRYDAVVELITNSYTYYYQATILSLIDMNYKLQQKGVTSYIMDKNNEILVYTLTNNGVETSYLKCTEPEKEETLAKLEASKLDKNLYKDLECKLFVGDIAGDDHDIEIYTQNYNTVTSLVNKFLEQNYKNRTNKERHLVYTSGTKKGQTQVTNTIMQVKSSIDLMSWDKDNHSFILDLSKFYQIDQGEFEGWCDTIRRSSIIKHKDGTITKLTFREYLKESGYVSETDLTNVKYLVLGSRTVSKKSFDDYYNNWFGFENAWQLMTVELDTVIDTFCANKNYHPVTYCTYGQKHRKDNNCAVSFWYSYGVMESHNNKLDLYIQSDSIVSDNFDKNWRDGSRAVYPTKYLTIEGLSVKKSSGTTNPTEVGHF